MKQLFLLLAVPVLIWSIEYNESSGQTRPFNLTAGAKAEWDNPGGNTIIEAGQVTLFPGKQAITAKPNPFNALIHLRWTLKPGEQASLSIYDISGRRVSYMTQSRTDHFAWNAGHLASGVYTVVVHAGNGKLTQRITLMK